MDYDALERKNAEDFTRAARRLYEMALAEARQQYPIGSLNLVTRRAKAVLRSANDMICRGEISYGEEYTP